MTERTTVRLPEELLIRAKRKAAADGRTLTALIEDGLRIVVSEDRRSGKKNSAMPRVSKAGGGLMPGTDLISPSTLQEADDLDFVRRLQRRE